jgi:beta-lactamase class A
MSRSKLPGFPFPSIFRWLRTGPARPLHDEAAPLQTIGLETAFERALTGDDLRHASVVAYRLRDGRGVSFGADHAYYAASTFKLAILYALERAGSRGEIDLDSPLTITAADAEEDLGTLGELPLAPDGSLPIREAARAMITLSDNSTAVALLHRLGGANVNAELRQLGISTFDVNTPDLPVDAADLARLMEAVVRGEGVGAPQRDEMRDFLLGQETRSGIPAGLPTRVSVGNKTGTWPGITHDVAFVEAPAGTYVVAILTDEGWNWERVARISRIVYGLLGGDSSNMPR